jgi:hypothetical protein
MQRQTFGVDNGRHWWEDATMLTLEDFVSQLVSRGSPNARVVFDNGDDLELEKIVAVNPATEVRVVFKDEERERITKLADDAEAENDQLKSEIGYKAAAIVNLIIEAKENDWDSDTILRNFGKI